jgi:hypothetical protein
MGHVRSLSQNRSSSDLLVMAVGEVVEGRLATLASEVNAVASCLLLQWVQGPWQGEARLHGAALE